jgi:hypothetical protein
MAREGELIWYYGSYEHPVGEVYPRNIEVRPLQSDMGVRWGTVFRMSVAGSFVNQSPELTPKQVGTRIQDMKDAYRDDYKDCGFKHSDGTLTPHRIVNADPFNLSGTKIVHRSWDNVYPTEYANTRSFSVTVQSLYLSEYNDVVYFHETTQKIGTGGEVWRLYNQWDGTPVRETVFNTSKVIHVTRGTIVGLYTWPTPPPPLWPLEEQEWKRQIVYGSPKHHGDLSFLKGTHYAVSYAYFFERNGPDATSPYNTWFNG